MVLSQFRKFAVGNKQWPNWASNIQQSNYSLAVLSSCITVLEVYELDSFCRAPFTDMAETLVAMHQSPLQFMMDEKNLVYPAYWKHSLIDAQYRVENRQWTDRSQKIGRYQIRSLTIFDWSLRFNFPVRDRESSRRAVTPKLILIYNQIDDIYTP